MGPQITIVIATFGRPSLLERTLESLALCRKPKTFDQTIVVENGGEKEAASVVQKAHPSLKIDYYYLKEANKSLALNFALSRIGNSLVVFFDDDVQVEKDVLVAYEKSVADMDGGYFFGGPSIPQYEKRPPDWLMEYLPFSARGLLLQQPPQNIHFPIFLGLNWAAFSQDIKACGGFNPRLGASETMPLGDEYDLQSRLIKRGVYGRYISSASVWHYVPPQRCSSAWALKRVYREGLGTGIGLVSKGSGISRSSILRAFDTKFNLRRSLRRICLRSHRWFRIRYYFYYLKGILDGDRGCGSFSQTTDSTWVGQRFY